METSVPTGWSSEAISWPLGVKEVEKTPGLTSMVLTTDPRVPFGLIGKVSMLLGSFSITTRVLPFGLTVMSPPPEFLAVRSAVELGIWER